MFNQMFPAPRPPPYQWFKMKPEIFDFLMRKQQPPDPVLTRLRHKCVTLLRNEMKSMKEDFQRSQANRNPLANKVTMVTSPPMVPPP